MCTVTFVPAGNRVFITSNRDERSTRQPAEPPLPHTVSGVTLLFPKDGDKGGTWIAVNKNGDAGVLLNGATRPHAAQPLYRHSRGLILPQLLSATDPMHAFSVFDTHGIEPFTMVLYVGKRLYECRWDGAAKTVHPRPINRPHIWSSATLYNDEMQASRKDWFDQWVQANPAPDAESIFGLHRLGGRGDAEVDYVMNRNHEMMTVSISSVELSAEQAVVTYHQVQEKRTYRSKLSFSAAHSSSWSRWWRRFVIRLTHWEYWPFHAVYAPIYPYWFWLSLKARSVFFFTASNPTIRNGGFLMESKKEIYDLMPEGSYPKTKLLKKEDGDIQAAIAWMRGEELSFPMIAKPDIGLRGQGVQLLRTIKDLERYHQQSRVDYLLQEYVPYENEVGIFYCRLPGSSQGKITSVVGKELLTVTGDGISTVEELILKKKRSLLQLEALGSADPAGLTQVLAPDEKKLLVPYGNHARGARFIDLTPIVDERLRQTIDTLCLQIPGFYFGRLDVRYNNWEELCAGKNFSVIELNGAGSEPAHIYDPRHSIFFGWKEIIRHLNLLYRISKYNKRAKQGSYLSWKEGVDLFRQNAAYVKKIS